MLCSAVFSLKALLLIIYTLSHDALFPCGNSCHYERCIIHIANFALGITHCIVVNLYIA